MKFSKRIVKIGYSFGVILDMNIRNKLKLKKGDWVEVDVKVIKE